MNNKAIITIFISGVFIAGYFYLTSSKPLFNFSSPPSNSRPSEGQKVNQAVTAKFEYLSRNGNSSCSSAFRDSISSMADSARLQGSCCSPMSLHRYSEQVEGLKKFKSQSSQNIAQIPDDPYDIEARLAKELMSYYDMELNPEEQKAYDYAMDHSSEKGPCCCKCWRWNTYGGLGKYVIHNYKFTGEQLTELWNLSDGCGGDNEHHHA